MDEGRGGIESDRQPLLTGRETEPETNVGLAGAAVADRDDILPAGHILRAGELQHEGLVERRNGGELEAVQALHGREPRLLDPTLHHAPLAVDQLQFGQAQQEARDSPPLRPASDASSGSCEKLRFSSGTLSPPFLAISRRSSSLMLAKPRSD